MTAREETAALRIGLYTSSLPQSHAKPPGVDVFVDRLGERLARRGHHVDVLTYSPPGAPRSYHLRSLRPASSATSRVRRLAVAPLRLNALDTSRLDVLHLHGDDWFYLRRQLPTVRTLHGSALYEARHATSARRRTVQYLTYGLERLAGRLATGSYGVNPDPGPGSGRSGYLPLAVDLPSAWSAERPGPPLVLFVGTWAGRKRGRLLHEMFLREVRPRVPDARLVMVSDHAEPGPGVEWIARPSDEELAELYRAAWLFCMPSSYEGFGLPYLEAMAHGTPVLATDNPGARFVLDRGRAGVIADTPRLGSDIAALLGDARARTELAHAGRRRAAEFSWDGLLDAHERAYRDAIAAFRPRRRGGHDGSIGAEEGPRLRRALIVMPLATQRGGAELMFRQLIENRERARLEPIAVFLEPGPLVDRCRHEGVPAFTVDAGRLRHPLALAHTVLRLQRIATRTRCEVVIGWMAKAHLYGGPAAALAGLPSMWLQAGPPTGRATIDRLATLIPTDAVVTLSRTTDAAQRKLVPRRRTAVVYPAVDLKRFAAARLGHPTDVRRRLGLPDDASIFGSVGRLDSWKGFHILLDALPPILERHPDATFVLVGGRHELASSYGDALHDQAARLGYDGRVRLVGHQDRPEEWIQAMDVFVHTSRNEAFGIVVIEAMALGKAVIASDEGGPTEIITPGVDGLLSPYGDAPALADAIMRLLGDEPLRRRIGLAAARRAQDFTVQRYAQAFGDMVAEATGSSRDR
ncbi:MAG: glycosyltransferase family 4 protein [Solirubrobacterales bacterium]|nr:glycosyltransferase family 4 protein [Solirubrobacterales bacterium]